MEKLMKRIDEIENNYLIGVIDKKEAINLIIIESVNKLKNIDQS